MKRKNNKPQPQKKFKKVDDFAYLDFPAGAPETPAEDGEDQVEVFDQHSEEGLQKMGYMRKVPLFIGSTSGLMDFGDVIEYITTEFVKKQPDVIPVIFDTNAARQVEKFIINKSQEASRINQFAELREVPENVLKVFDAAMRLKSFMGTTPFTLKRMVERTKHTYKNATDLLLLMYVMGFVVRWKVSDEMHYQVISSQQDFEAFAQRRINEAAEKIYELELYIDNLRAMANLNSNGAEIINEVLEPQQGVE